MGRCVQLMDRLQKILTIAFFSILTILKSGQLLACSCDGGSTVKESVKYSDIVFKGQVISKTITSDLSYYGVTLSGDTTSYAYKWTRNPVAVFKIKVDKIYKGKSQSDTIFIITPTDGRSCGFGFQVGQNYIIYGTTNDEVLPGNSIKRYSTNHQTYWTNLCTRTTLFFQTEEDDIKAIKS